MSRVDLTRSAEADLIEIWDHVADTSVIQADRLLNRFAAKFSHLADHPGLGRPRPELAPDCRSYPLGKYGFYYRPTDEGILLLRVLHSARDIRRLRFRG